MNTSEFNKIIGNTSVLEIQEENMNENTKQAEKKHRHARVYFCVSEWGEDSTQMIGWGKSRDEAEKMGKHLVWDRYIEQGVYPEGYNECLLKNMRTLRDSSAKKQCGDMFDDLYLFIREFEDEYDQKVPEWVF